MASRKRARAADSPSSAAAATKITLSGGEAHHSSLVAFWRKEKFTDIAVCAEGVEFKAHCAALASSSGYFLSLFDSGMRDAASPTHALEGLRSPVLEALLAFVYEGSCEVEEGLLTEMLDASARLVIDPLKAACAYAIQAQLAPCNALDVWRLADLYTLPALEEGAVTSALGGFEELPPQSASGAQVLALVQEDRLDAKNEEAVFQWVVRWWEAAQPTEAELLAAMKHVRFAVMDAGFVETTVRAWPALDSREGRNILRDSLLKGGHALVRTGFGPRLVYVLGGSVGDDDWERLNTVETYDPRTGAWKQVSAMPTIRIQHTGVVLDSKIYAIGGYEDNDDRLSTADVYDPQTDQWRPLAKMATGRVHFAAAAAAGKIYAIGGEIEDRVGTATVEAFDPQLGAWAPVANMSVERKCHAVAVVDGKIFAIGGLPLDPDGYVLDSVEVYDPQADSWQQVASMPRRIHRHAATAMGGKIYVSGGDSDDDSTVSTLMVFDPQANTWTQLASMGTARADHTSAAIGGKLYVLGGYHGSSGRRVSVEAYDPISNKWARVSDLTEARDEFVAVTL
eukprot:scaffold51032_cov64-Phaeocystis_antarctica.AAC.5